ncbi:hypothetical protein ACE193_05625 [Bernardetia sp. OM2101]|uniref:hypothetical protein n=1 Tax=Bernardetia sp. OM2101 TaxID=3344876 RepID=UPI0035D05B2B
MQRHFKYSKGYVNIDDTNIYLTETGNWSETKELSEKMSNQLFRRYGNAIAILGVCLVIALGGVFAFISSQKIRIGGVISVIAVLFFFYQAVSSKMGYKFYIPKEKIIKVSSHKNILFLKFKNASEKEEIVRISDIEKIDEVIELLKKE